MKEEKIKCLVVDVMNDTIDVQEIEASLESYYKIIGCSCIDIATRNVNGTYYDFIVDDEGLFVESPKPSCFDKDGKAVLFGNVIICQHDEEGNEKSLTDEEITSICHNLRYVAVTGFDKPYPAVIGVEY